MKRTFLLLATLILTTGLFAQSPEKMSYQSVVRDAIDKLVTNRNIGMQVSILKGSISGEVVYVERHFPSTNVNGLVSLEIGIGTIVLGDFSEIDWAVDQYFVKTEIDLNGGAQYTISGTSQFLSVPYALHARTAEIITGTITESDPIYTASHAANISATDITKLSNLSGNNTGDQNISGITTNASAIDAIQTQQTTQNAAIALNTIKVGYTDSLADARVIAGITNKVDKEEGKGLSTIYSVGDFAQGGIVYWVDETGQHGLVCTKEDQSTGVRWFAGTHGDTRSKGDGLFSGEANTVIIIAAHAAIGDDGGTYAARMCNELQITEGGKTYGDWYLPSWQELNLMEQNKSIINTTATANGGVDFATDRYWSSTERVNLSAWYKDFSNGGQGFNNKNLTYFVRAVRAF